MGALSEPTEPDPAERERRHLLSRADELLDAVEELRLTERRTVPTELAQAIALLQARLSRSHPAVAPATVAAAQNLVFALQQRLMAANPRNSTPRAHIGRAVGQPAFAYRGGARWKFLTLPPPGPAGPDGSWRELVEATVERARDRWLYAHHHALRAARERRPALQPLGRAAAAWKNYWDLVCDAERVTGSARMPPARPRP